jgi:hypothetical protein
VRLRDEVVGVFIAFFVRRFASAFAFTEYPTLPGGRVTLSECAAGRNWRYDIAAVPLFSM